MVKSVQAASTTAAYEALRANLQREREVAEKLVDTSRDPQAEADKDAPPAGGVRGQIIDIVA